MTSKNDRIIWNNEKRGLNELKIWERNPRQATEKQAQDLSCSLERFNLADPLIINTDGTIIGGHFRYRILKEKGVKEVDVRVPNRKLTEKEVEELNLRLNKNQGEWDYELLADFDEELLKDIGWEKEELDEIFELEIDDDNFDFEEELDKILTNKERRVKEGDLWKLGDHQLFIGDATKRESWERVLKEERFDFLFTDPPYKLSWLKEKKGFGYKEEKRYLGTLRMGRIPEYNEWLSNAKDFQSLIGSSVMIFENWRNYTPLRDAIENNGWKIKNMIIWHKLNKHFGFLRHKEFSNKYEIAFLGENGEQELNEKYEEELDNYLKENGQKLLDTYEIILYGYNKNSFWNPKEARWIRVQDHISSIVDTKKSSGTDLIGGIKPLQILIPYVKILSPRNGVVVDCFGGSGSTLIACEIMKRKCRMIEYEPSYGEVIINRWEKLTNQKAIKI